jgi:hypothetical protein
MTQLEQEVRNYAFNNDKDLDVSTFKIIMQTITEAVNRHTYKGLFDKCFKERTK